MKLHLKSAIFSGDFGQNSGFLQLVKMFHTPSGCASAFPKLFRSRSLTKIIHTYYAF